jgi:hypothetical protein
MKTLSYNDNAFILFFLLFYYGKIGYTKKEKGFHNMKKALDSYITVNEIWAMAYELIGDYEYIKIIMDNNGYEVINTITSEVMLWGEII